MDDYTITFARSASKELEKLAMPQSAASFRELKSSQRFPVRKVAEKYRAARICGVFVKANIASSMPLMIRNG